MSHQKKFQHPISYPARIWICPSKQCKSWAAILTEHLVLWNMSIISIVIHVKAASPLWCFLMPFTSKHLKCQLDPPVSDVTCFAPKEVSWIPLSVTWRFLHQRRSVGAYRLWHPVFQVGFSWFQVGLSWFQVGFSWLQVSFHGFSWLQVGFHGFHWFQAYMQKAGDCGDISPQFFLDFPQNFRLRTRNQYCTQAIAWGSTI